MNGGGVVRGDVKIAVENGRTFWLLILIPVVLYSKAIFAHRRCLPLSNQSGTVYSGIRASVKTYPILKYTLI